MTELIGRGINDLIKAAQCSNIMKKPMDGAKHTAFQPCYLSQKTSHNTPIKEK